MKNKNQDPNFYSKDYFLKSCAGATSFTPGQDNDHSIFNYILNLIPTFKNLKILDIGSGRGEICLATVRRGAQKAIGIDLSPHAIQIATENLQEATDIDKSQISFLNKNALELDLNEKFDLIFLTDVVEHLYDNQLNQLFLKIKEHLSPNGKIVIHTMPTRDFIRIGQFFKAFIYFCKGKKYNWLTFANQAEETHVNLQSKESLRKHLKTFNYKIWYDFSVKSFLKSLVSKTPLIRFLSSNLWAIASHKD